MYSFSPPPLSLSAFRRRSKFQRIDRYAFHRALFREAAQSSPVARGGFTNWCRASITASVLRCLPSGLSGTGVGVVCSRYTEFRSSYRVICVSSVHDHFFTSRRTSPSASSSLSIRGSPGCILSIYFRAEWQIIACIDREAFEASARRVCENWGKFTPAIVR